MANREYKLLVHATVTSLIEEIGSLQKDGWLKSAPLVRSGDDFLQAMHRYSGVSNEGGRPNVSDFVDKMSDLLKEDCVVNVIKAAGKSEADFVRSIAYPKPRH